MNVPLPGLIPNENGGYTVCPKCVMMWAGLIAGLVLLWFIFRQKGTAEIGRK